MSKLSGAQLLIKCLEAQGVDFIFGIPGAKIDAAFDALLDSKIKLIVCRHEQNAAFMAGAYGRITGKPGVVLVTSGPGVANLATGLLTATTEGDPVIAIGGNVPLPMALKQSHQRTNNVNLMQPVTKSSVEVYLANTIPEVIENAFRQALTPTCGACFISIPQDVLEQQSTLQPLPALERTNLCRAQLQTLEAAGELISQANQPVLLLGMEASRPHNALAIRQLLEKNPLVVVSTYQAAGAISQDLLDCFMGRVGLFKNQPGDKVLDAADVVVTIGFNPVEYDPEIWNDANDKIIIHIDYTPCYIRETYHPKLEVLGDIAVNIRDLSHFIHARNEPFANKKIKRARQSLLDKINLGKELDGQPIHPLRFIYELRQAIDDSTTVCCDVGTVYMWMARYFFSYAPHHLLFSNGQQTLGVAMPWAMASYLARPNHPVVAISGDGGFLFSAMELETAVRESMKFIHFIWRDGSYNMVLEQELMKYQRKSGVDFGRIDIPEFAAAFGAVGMELTDPDLFQEIVQEAFAIDKPVLIDVPIDYSDNADLFKIIDPHQGH